MEKRGEERKSIDGRGEGEREGKQNRKDGRCCKNDRPKQKRKTGANLMIYITKLFGLQRGSL